MTIIKVTIQVEDCVHANTRRYKSGREEEIEIHTKKIDNSCIKIEANKCSCDCSCKYDSDEPHDDKIFAEIKAITNDNYPSWDNLQKIRKLIANNKYALIQSLLDESLMEDEDKFYNIRNIVNNDIDVVCDITKNSTRPNDDQNDEKIIRYYPFVVNFVADSETVDQQPTCGNTIIRTYTASMHVPEDYYSNVVFITKTQWENGMGCSLATYEEELPIQLSITSPVKGGGYFAEYDKVMAYKKMQYENKYEYSYEMSS